MSGDLDKLLQVNTIKINLVTQGGNVTFCCLYVTVVFYTVGWLLVTVGGVTLMLKEFHPPL